MFNLKDFQNANEGGDNGEKPVVNGDFSLELVAFNVKRKQDSKGSQMGLAVACTDGDHKGKWLWTNQTLYNNDGGPNDVGLRMIQQWCNKLSGGMWDLANWTPDVEGDEASTFAAINNDLEKFVGSTFQGSVSTKVGEYTNYTIKCKRLLESKYVSSGVADSSDEPVTEQEEELKVGQALIYIAENGKQHIGKVTTFVENPSGEGMIVVETDGTQVTIKESQVRGIASKQQVEEQNLDADVDVSPNDDDILSDDDGDDDLLSDDEEELFVVEKGKTVKCKRKGELVEGEVHKIDEDTGEVTVAVTRPDGKKVGVKTTVAELQELN